jgi:hypothetical protein
MKNRMRELRTCGTVRGEGHEVLAYSEKSAHSAQRDSLYGVHSMSNVPFSTGDCMAAAGPRPSN